MSEPLLSTYSVQGAVLGAEDTAMMKQPGVPARVELMLVED